ncbi:tetratricopeptide repeat protein [Novosphingobium sp. G106]|uniref:tetratricopeptide repeat protein n=1 Tax=Novosphingobium sp. G106 TaxID=2849500 RepID=UPI001C2CCD45|nr:tetratricopeptide repeat protein [Novosphingobium sp. G106]MBV1690161.1 tetratricopeptide repeat protein [Novosphingobium sp. G106]
MTQEAIAKMPLGRIALLIAALIAAFAVGVAIMRKPAASPPPSAPVAAADNGMVSIETLEKRTQAQPDDVSGWQMLGAAYYNEARYEDAVRAYDKASTLAPEKPAVWSALGEARVMASKSDPMPATAAAAFERAIALDAKDPRARYFLAVKRDLSGDHEGAVADWLALLADSPADAPWRTDLVRTIEQVGKIHKIDVAPRIAAAGAKSPEPTMPVVARGIPGPIAQDINAASAMAPSEQRQMAEGMVARLEARLKGSPKDPDGWLMLMRSRVTLGQPEKASQALKDALAANPDKAGMIRDQASMLGVK